MKKLSIISLLIIIPVLFFAEGCCCCFVSEPSGVPANTSEYDMDILSDPYQYDLDEPENIVLKAKDTPLLVTPVAGFNITARVKSKKKYGWDWSSEIAPYDLALVWGDLTTPEVDKHIRYRQSNRWYFFRYDADCPVSESYIYNHSSNMHIIPSGENIKKVLDRVKVNDDIYMEGYLINIKGTIDGRNVWWNTSKSRRDRGDHACEVFYVKKIILDNTVYN